MEVKEEEESVEKKRNVSFLVNFVAGGVAGTLGTIVTCPLDVVQTRLQSSEFQLNSSKILQNSNQPRILSNVVVQATLPQSTTTTTTTTAVQRPLYGRQVLLYIRYIVHTEGLTALYKGLVPNLIGVAPSRALYFAVYSQSKHLVSTASNLSKDNPWVHMASALSASLTVSTTMNPIWFLKTRLQLDQTERSRRRALRDVIKETLKSDGIGGFYRGLSASYAGSLETISYFVIYEKLKMIMSEQNNLHSGHYMCAAFLAKTIASTSFYPHEVVRTRLRQKCGDGGYRGFFRTLWRVGVEEGVAGLYGGMGAHVMRQVPNTVIMFMLYEMIVDFMTKE